MSDFADDFTLHYERGTARIGGKLRTQADCERFIAIVRLVTPMLHGPIPLVEAAERITPEPQEPAVAQVVDDPEEITPAVADPEPPAGPEEAAPEPEEPETPDEPSAPVEGALTAAEQIVKDLWPDLSVSVGQIAKQAGCSGPTVYNIRRRLGLPDRSEYAAEAFNVAIKDGEAKVAEPLPPDEDDDLAQTEAAPQTNGHVVVARDGIFIDVDYGKEAIVVGDKRMDLSTSGAALLQILLKAAPNPVGHRWITDRVYPGVKRDDAEERLRVLSKDLTHGLPAVGLELKDIKAVGLALGGVE